MIFILFFAWCVLVGLYVKFEQNKKVRNLIYFVICIALTFAIFGCSSSKLKTRKQAETLTYSTEVGTETITRKGDTISYVVPNIRFKDTTIIVENRTAYGGNNQLRIVYDKEGNKKIDCIESDLEFIKQYIRKTEEEKRETLDTKEKESLIKPSTIIYIFIGLALLLIVNKIANKFI